MSLVLKEENFKIFDVSGIKVKKKLAFEKNEKNLVARNEDEAFIKEFIRERDGAKIGPQKIMLWGSALDWSRILWEIDTLHRCGWVKNDILKGREVLPDIVKPDPIKDQVEDDATHFSGFYSLDRYIEKTVYETTKHDEAWELPSMGTRTGNLSGRIKKLDEFTAIYRDFSKMNGMWLQPKEGLKLSMSCSARLDDIKDDDEYNQSVDTISISLEHSTDATVDQGSLTIENPAKTEYKDANENIKTYQFSETCIWKKENHYQVKIKDGKDSEGTLKYKEVKTESEIVVDVKMDTTNMMYETIEGEELQWDLKAAIFMVHVDVMYHDYETGKGSTAYREFIVKADVQDKNVIAGESIRNKLRGEIPELKGKMTSMQMHLSVFGWLGDIKWNMKIEEE